MKKSFLLLLCFSATILLRAQNTNPLDEKYQPPKTSPFGKSGGSESKSVATSDRKSNVLSFVVTDNARQNFRFLFEKKLGGNYSATLGLGIAYGNDLFEQNMGLYELTQSMDGNNSEIYITSLYENSKRTSGFNTSLSIKNHFYENGNYTTYWDLGWRMMYNHHKITDGSYYKPNSLDFNAKVNHFTFMMGFSLRTSGNRRVVVNDFSYGLAFKYAIWDKYVERVDANSNHFREIQKEMTSSAYSVIFLIRYQVGIGW